MNYQNAKRAGWMISVALLSFSSLQLSASEPAPITVIWNFDSAAEPALPETNGGLSGAQASVTAGPAGLGWVNQFPGLNSQGLYDLGQQGKINVRLGTAAGISGPATVSVKVKQWFDGFIFASFVDVSVPGGVPVALEVGEGALGPVGGWVEVNNSWTIPAGVTVPSAVITGPANGAVVDQLTLAVVTMAAVGPAVDPAVLSIRQVGTQIEISWPASAGSGVLESSGDPASASSWAATDLTATLTGDHYVVTTTIEGTSRFFRLHK